MAKDPLATKNVGNHPTVLKIISYKHFLDLDPESFQVSKNQDMRYGTNPSQTAALYNTDSFLGKLREHKSGKEGMSQTNYEDVLYAALSVMYFDAPSIVIMKHENPSGFATQYEPEPLAMTYRKAFDSDFRAAFGGTVFSNSPIDMETAEAVKTFTEVLVAPDFDEGVVGRFKGSIRILQYDIEDLQRIPKYVGDASEPEIKRLPDGSVIISDVFLSPIRTAGELKQYVISDRKPTEMELKDLLTAYRLRVRSNSVRMVKNGYTTGIGTGQQDRVMCIDIAAHKNRKLKEAKREGAMRVANYEILGSSMASDGFFPFPDSIELVHDLGITAVLAPHGGRNFDKVLEKSNEYTLAFVDLPAEMRFFDHH